MFVTPLKVTWFWKVVVALTVNVSVFAVPRVVLSSTLRSLVHAVAATPIPPAKVTDAVDTLEASVVSA